MFGGEIKIDPRTEDSFRVVIERRATLAKEDQVANIVGENALKTNMRGKGLGGVFVSPGRAPRLSSDCFDRSAAPCRDGRPQPLHFGFWILALRLPSVPSSYELRSPLLPLALRRPERNLPRSSGCPLSEVNDML